MERWIREIRKGMEGDKRVGGGGFSLGKAAPALHPLL